MRPNQTFLDFQMRKDKIILIHEQNTPKNHLRKLSLTSSTMEGENQRIFVSRTEESPPEPKSSIKRSSTMIYPPQNNSLTYISSNINPMKQRMPFSLKEATNIFLKAGVEGRIYRTYPSLIRVYHFFLSCQEMNRFDDVFYSFRRDQDGVDTVIKYKGQNFAIALFVDTPRSRSYKKKKYNRHKALDIPEICVMINPFDKSTYVGDYALYQDYHLYNMVKEMESILNKESIEA